MRFFFAAGIILELTVPATGATWLVRADAQGLNQGTSWADAFVDLQDALAVANPGDEIWVAAGIYRPDRGTGDLFMAFELACGVKLYGGFAGWETALEQRDWVANETVLSGDLNGDDGPRNCDQVSNCCYEHEGLGCDDAECLKLICPPDTTYQHCCDEIVGDPDPRWDDRCADAAKIICCHLGDWNGCDNSVAVIKACDCDSSTVVDGLFIERAYFSSYRDVESGQYSAGLIVERSPIAVSNTVFRDNASPAILIVDSAIRCSQSEFLGNSSGVNGTGDASFADCLFQGNVVGAIVTGDCKFLRSSFLNNRDGLHANLFIYDGHVRIDDCSFRDNKSHGIYASHTVSLTNSIVSNSGGGGVYVNGGSLIARNSRFSGDYFQAALSLSLSGGLVENCLLDGGRNQQFNSVVYADGSPIEFRNTTFANNLGADHPSVITTLGSLRPSPITLTNCIFWVGDDYNIGPDDLLKAYHPGASFTVNRSIIQGWSGAMGGEGNSGVSPQFIDPDGPDNIPGNEDDDFRLGPGSPGINSGDPKFVAGADETDLDGHARVLCGAVDIGAYEFGIGDFNCDQGVDLLDQATWDDCMTNPRPSAVRPGCEAFDFNADSDIDLADFASFERAMFFP